MQGEHFFTFPGRRTGMTSQGRGTSERRFDSFAYQLKENPLAALSPNGS